MEGIVVQLSITRTGPENMTLYCVAALERVPALHYSVDFIFLSFGIMNLIVEL